MEQHSVSQYREDQCECAGGVECAADKAYRMQRRVRKLFVYSVSLQDRLAIAEQKLLNAVMSEDKRRMKGYRAQVRMIQGRIAKEERYAVLTDEIASSSTVLSNQLTL